MASHERRKRACPESYHVFLNSYSRDKHRVRAIYVYTSTRSTMAADAWTARCTAWGRRVEHMIPSVVDAGPTDAAGETKDDMKARARCEQWKDDLLRTSPMVRFMVKHLALVSCNPLTPRAEGTSPSVPPKLLIASCPPDIAGGFSPSAPAQPPSESGILLCANRIFSKAHLEDTLAHEMIHWYDHCRFLVDWSNLRHHACSEIRAASLSGDCSFSREVNRRHFGMLKQHQACARRRAILSVRGNPACKDEAMAEQAVNDVWESCFHDTRPFDEVCTIHLQPDLLSYSHLPQVLETLRARIDTRVQRTRLITHALQSLVLCIHFLAHRAAKDVHTRTQRSNLV